LGRCTTAYGDTTSSRCRMAPSTKRHAPPAHVDGSRDRTVAVTARRAHRQGVSGPWRRGPDLEQDPGNPPVDTRAEARWIALVRRMDTRRLAGEDESVV